MKFTFSIVQVAYAHEEGATSVTPDNITGPFLTLIIIVLAVVAAKRIKKIKISSPAKIFKENLGGQK